MQLPFIIPSFSRRTYGISAAVLLLIGGYAFFGGGNNLGATFTVSQGDFKEQVRVSGTVTAAKNVELGFASSGRIAGTYASVGARVEAGTILADIENGDLAASLAQKKANLASLIEGTRPEQLAVKEAAVQSARAKVVDAITTAYTVSDDAVHNKTDSFFINPRIEPKLSFALSSAVLKDTVENDRSAIDPVFASWARALSGLTEESASSIATQSTAYLARVTTLLADVNAALNQSIPDQATSAATLSSYATTLSTARANVNTAATALTNAVSALSDAETTLALSKAGSTASDITAAQAEVENARAVLAKTRVVAPFSGVVTRMDAKAGEVVSPTTSKISMQSDGIFQIETYVPEVAIARVAVGNTATTTLDAYGSAVAFPSIVVAVDPAETIQDGVPAYKTTLAFLAKDERIRSGMTADIMIETGVLRDAVVIPAGAIGSKNGMPYVSVVERGEAVSRTVTTGPSPMLGQAYIVSGLAEGDTILLAPVP